MSESQQSQRHCTGCGQAIESAAAKFCQHCGQAIVRRAPRPSDWSQPFGGFGCASKILALCAIASVVSAIGGLLFGLAAVFDGSIGGVLVLVSMIWPIGLTIVFLRVRELGLRDEQSREP